MKWIYFLLLKYDQYKFNKTLDGTIWLEYNLYHSKETDKVKRKLDMNGHKYTVTVKINDPDWVHSISVPFYPQEPRFSKLIEVNQLKNILTNAKIVRNSIAVSFSI